MSQLFLARNTFAREVNDQGIFLDIERDKYWAIGGAHLQSVRRVVHGWSGEGDAERWGSEPDEMISSVLCELLEAKLLTPDPSAGKSMSTPHLEAPECAVDFAWLREERPDRRLLIQAFGSWVASHLRLTWLPLRHVIRRLARRKAIGLEKWPVFDLAQVRYLSAVAWILQPLFYSQKDACLQNSLTLMEFLNRYHIYPTLVFGVKTSPFAAHSWVQLDSLLLNDSIKNTQKYTPLMVV